MTVWDHSFTIGQFMLDFALISGLLIVATMARRYVGFLQRFLVPNSLTAGFLGLIFGPELLHLVDFSLDRMGVYVFHLLALTFIGVGLQSTGGQRSRGAVTFGFIQILSFLLQVIIGLGVALFIAHLINPDLVPAVGTLLPLGFGMGPGIAYTIGQSWEAYGFNGGGSMGLTVAAIGFLVAYGHGVLIVNRGLREGQGELVTSSKDLAQDVRTGFVKDTEPAVGSRMTLLPGAIEPLTFHVALIGGIYLLTYGLLTLIAMGLERIGMAQEVATLWSFLFVFANLVALGVRTVLAGRRLTYLLDEGLLHRTTGLLADLLIATSVMAISLTITWDYLVPILAMCGLGTLVTYTSIKWVGARVFADYPFERFVGIYGEMTGTISSGLALVRVTDPEYSTPIAQDLVLGSGMALVLGFPLLLVINLPFTAFAGALHGYWVVLGLALVYLVFIFAVWTRYGLRLKARR